MPLVLHESDYTCGLANRLCAPRAQTVCVSFEPTLSDVKDGEIKMVGKGDFPFRELVARLKDVGYDGPLMIEQYAKNYDSYDEVKESVEYLKNILEA